VSRDGDPPPASTPQRAIPEVAVSMRHIPAHGGTPWSPTLGSRGDLDDRLGFDVDLVDHRAEESQLERLFRF
jgi:hypothetical protein